MSVFLSVIVPAYRVEPYLRACLDSIASQSEQDIEVIVIDDGSPDASGAIADAYAARDERFSALHQPNGGVSRARNAGLDRVRGEWIWFVDGDDLIVPNAVARLKEAAMQTKDADILCFRHQMYPCRVESAQNIKPILLTLDDLHALRLRNIYPRADLPCSRIPVLSASFRVYRAELIARERLRFRPDMPSGQDALFLQKALTGCRSAVFLDTPLYLYRRNENSISIRCNRGIVHAKLALLHAFRDEVAAVADERAEELFRCRAMASVRQCLCLWFCHCENRAPYRERRAAFRAMMEEPVIREAYRDLSVMRVGGLQRLAYWLVQQQRFGLLDPLYRIYTRLR